MNYPPRFPWDHFPPAYIHASEPFVRTHPAFLAPMLISSQVEENAGLSVIPQMTAFVLSSLLKWPFEKRVTQSGGVAITGYERLQHQTIFDGPVVIGLNYLLVDEFIAYGGTLANFRGHILKQNGYVIGATVLAGDDFHAELALSDRVLAELRSRHGHIEYWWRQRFGFGFESLTASEARYLNRARSSKNIIESLEAIAR